MTTRRPSPFHAWILRWAGDSNRPGHLKLNKYLSLALVGVALFRFPAGPGPVAWWLGVAAVCRLTEVLITPDVDSAESWGRSRGGPTYRAWWWIYGKKTPHRHWASHSLLIGLPIRLAWAGLPVLVAGVGACTAMVYMGCFPRMDAQDAALDALTMTIRLQLPWMVLTGAGMSDLGHYLLDDFGPIEMLFGKGNK